jgi:hypothetical protein
MDGDPSATRNDETVQPTFRVSAVQVQMLTGAAIRPLNWRTGLRSPVGNG